MNYLPAALGDSAFLFADDVKVVLPRTQSIHLFSSLSSTWAWAGKWDLPIYPNKCACLTVDNEPFSQNNFMGLCNFLLARRHLFWTECRRWTRGGTPYMFFIRKPTIALLKLIWRELRIMARNTWRRIVSVYKWRVWSLAVFLLFEKKCNSYWYEYNVAIFHLYELDNIQVTNGHTILFPPITLCCIGLLTVDKRVSLWH